MADTEDPADRPSTVNAGDGDAAEDVEPVVGNAGQIDSSDEYDPAPDVQDLSSPPDPPANASVDPSSHSASRPASAHTPAAAAPPADTVLDAPPLPDLTTDPQPPSALEPSPSPAPPATSIEEDMGKKGRRRSSGHAATAVARPRLPHDTIGLLEDRIKEDAKGDLEAWLGLIDEYRKRGQLDDVRKVYERFLALFPQAVSPDLKPRARKGFRR